MEERERLCSAIKKIGWGYIFLYFDINLGTMSILPSWVAYVLFQSGIANGVSAEEESVKLLQPIGIILGIYQGIMWLCKMFMIPTDVLIINETASILSLYFHFQLLTNLANIARKYECPQEKPLLNLRTIQTILLTVLAFTTQFEKLYEISMILVIVQIIIMICLCVELRRFKHELETLS